MVFEKIRIGKEGEQLAVQSLEGRGYRIVERNFRNNLGEIDIIALDADTVCFIEVKRRRSGSKGTPFDAVSKTKQHKLSRVALSYLKFKNLIDKRARFDIVSITRDEGGQNCVTILKNAFDLSSRYAY